MRPLTHPHGAHLMPSRGFLAIITRSLQELVEPVMKLMLEVMTAMILGFFFVVQSISIVVSLDLIVAAIIKSIQTGLYHLISWFTWCLASERERKAVGFALIDFVSNILWAEIICHLNAAVRRDFFFVPAVSYGIIFMMFTMFSTRLEVDLGDQAHQLMLFVMLIGQCAMFYVTALATAPATIFMTIFLLKCNIDMQFIGMELLVKAVIPPKDMDNNVWFFMSEILRRSFWLGLTIHQTLLREKHDRGILLMLVFHDLLAVSMPVRKLIAKVKHDRIIAQRFASLSAEELVALRDENCAVCLNEHSSESRRLPCGHVLHSGCLNRVLQSTARGQNSRCPICRADIPFTPPSSSSSSTSSQSAAGAMGGANGAMPTPHVNPMREIIRVRIITQGMLPAAMGLSPPPASASSASAAAGHGNNPGGNTLRQRRGGSALSQRILEYHQVLQQQQQQQRQLHPRQQSQQAIYHSSGDLSEYSSGDSGQNSGLHNRRTHRGLHNIINPPRQSALSDLFGHSSYRSYINTSTNSASMSSSSPSTATTATAAAAASSLFSTSQDMPMYMSVVSSSDPHSANTTSTSAGTSSAQEVSQTLDTTTATTMSSQTRIQQPQSFETENSLDSLLQIMEESDEENDTSADDHEDSKEAEDEEERRQLVDLLQQHETAQFNHLSTNTTTNAHHTSSASDSASSSAAGATSSDRVRRMTLVTPSEAAADLQMASEAYLLHLQQEQQQTTIRTHDTNASKITHNIFDAANNTDNTTNTNTNTDSSTNNAMVAMERASATRSQRHNMRSRDRRRKSSRRVVASDTGTQIDSSDTDNNHDQDEEEEDPESLLEVEKVEAEEEEDAPESKRPRHT